MMAMSELTIQMTLTFLGPQNENINFEHSLIRSEIK